MRREWEVRREGRAWYWIRRPARWISAPVLVGLAITAGGGLMKGLWDAFTAWLWDTAHLAPATAFAVVAATLVLVLLWKAGR